MALPNAANVGTLDYVYLATPEADSESKTGQNTGSLDYVFLATPFIGADAGAAPSYNTAQFFMVFF